MEIANQRVAYIHYVLTNDGGEVLDRSERDAPLAYLHGGGNIIPGLENALTGRSPGEKLKVTVTPQEGYGERDDALVQELPRKLFKDIDGLEVGMRLRADSDQGSRLVTVTGVKPDSVTIDANHALAGQTLHFEVEVADVRQATAEEMSHGHVHGPGGHAH
jgi:FKBP-type peptidyl-prolyl cis-trans isomerase SlyD